MNNDRRKQLKKLEDLLNELETLRSTAEEMADELASEEREYYDNMPESLQGSEKGEQADAAATALEEVRDALQELDVSDLLSKVEDAGQ